MDPDTLLWFCNLVGLLLFFTPWVLYYYTDSINSPYTYVLTALNCALALLHGAWTGKLATCLANGCGVALEMWYTLLFFRRSDAADPRRPRLIVLVICELACLVLAIGLSFVDLDLIKYVRCVVGLVVAAAPLRNVMKVIGTGSMATMPPFYLAIVSLFSAIVWTVFYKWIQLDNYLAAPNCMGIMSAGIQLALRAYFRWFPRLQLPIHDNPLRQQLLHAPETIPEHRAPPVGEVPAEALPGVHNIQQEEPLAGQPQQQGHVEAADDNAAGAVANHADVLDALAGQPQPQELPLAVPPQQQEHVEAADGNAAGAVANHADVLGANANGHEQV